jgi:hypothetical protein
MTLATPSVIRWIDVNEIRSVAADVASRTDARCFDAIGPRFRVDGFLFN